uniref:Uncharacterized protein n=1 Tax=Chenopodium quinoa TaxID=63459 RepID=A0A803N9M3_CHEQI
MAVVLKNEGLDALKVESYRESIIIERRITFESSSTLVLKDHQGWKVSNKKEELWELVEHFNIDVENPCVIMTQDKSREFLQSGNAKDKFKATLLQQVDDLLQEIERTLKTANELVQELEISIEPVVRELNELQAKIKTLSVLKNCQIEQTKSRMELKQEYERIMFDVQKKTKHVKSLKQQIAEHSTPVSRHDPEIREKRHYEKLQADKILPEIKEAEAKYQQLEQKRKAYSC